MGVHNGLPYLDDAIASILEQTFGDFEFLIIDDASTDGSREAVRRWAARDDRIRLLALACNRGLGYVLRRGLEEARAPLVARMDADDLALPDRLEAQVDFMRRHPEVHVLGGWTEDCDAEGRVTRLRLTPTRHERIADLVWTCPFLHPTVMMRRNAIQAVGSYDPSLRKRQDYDLWFRALEGGLGFANLPKTLVRYRFTDDYYRRNDVRVAWAQALIGWRGCWRTGQGPLAYVGAAWPFVRTVLPTPVGKWLHRQAHRVDPRRR
jgi:glycosyltransferase involved in cell wall biosynthesis